MICLDKFQRELCKQLGIDQATQPKLPDILKNMGFAGVKMGERLVSIDEMLQAPNMSWSKPLAEAIKEIDIPQASKQTADAYIAAAKEAENDFGGILRSFGNGAAIKDNHIVKSADSVYEKIARKGLDSRSVPREVDDFLRGAVVVKDNADLNAKLVEIANAKLPSATIEMKHTPIGYKGIHIQFQYSHNGLNIPAEIQLHTQKGWDIKKKQDEYYKALQRIDYDDPIAKQEAERMRRESIKLGEGHHLDMSDLTSFEVISPVSNSAKSVLRPKSSTLTQESLLNSNPPPATPSAYTRPDSTLRQNDENLSNSPAGITRGTNDEALINTPLKDSTESIAQESAKGVKSETPAPKVETLSNTAPKATEAQKSPANVAESSVESSAKTPQTETPRSLWNLRYEVEKTKQYVKRDDISITDKHRMERELEELEKEFAERIANGEKVVPEPQTPEAWDTIELEKLGAKRIKEMYIEVSSKAAKNKYPYINKYDLREAFLSKKGAAKIRSDKAVQKSIDNGFTLAQHFQAAFNTPTLYEYAILRETQKDRSGAGNLLIHRYEAPLIMDGENAVALLTLKETIKGDNAGSRIYSLELEGLRKVPSGQGEPPLPSKNTMNPEIVTPSNEVDDIIPQDSAKIPQEVAESIAKIKADGERNDDYRRYAQKFRFYADNNKSDFVHGIASDVNSAIARNDYTLAREIGEVLGFKREDYLATAKESADYQKDAYEKYKQEALKSGDRERLESLKKYEKNGEFDYERVLNSLMDYHLAINASHRLTSGGYNSKVILTREEAAKLAEYFEKRHAQMEAEYIKFQEDTFGEAYRAMLAENKAYNEGIERFMSENRAEVERFQKWNNRREELRHKAKLTPKQRAELEAMEAEAENVAREYYAFGDKLRAALGEGGDSLSIAHYRFDIPHNYQKYANVAEYLEKNGVKGGDSSVETPSVAKADESADSQVIWENRTTETSAESTPAPDSKLTIKTNSVGDFLLTNKDGKRQIIKKDLADAWKKEFDLAEITDDFTPNLPNQAKEALQAENIGEIHLKIGSLIKINAKKRSEVLPYIRPTIENPDKIIKDKDGGILFLKEFVEKDRHFLSVAKNFNGEWIFSSHLKRTIANVNNKLKSGRILYDTKGGEVVGASNGGTAKIPQDLQIDATNQSSGKVSNEIIPQNPYDLMPTRLLNEAREAIEAGRGDERVFSELREKIAKIDEALQKNLFGDDRLNLELYRTDAETLLQKLALSSEKERGGGDFAATIRAQYKIKDSLLDRDILDNEFFSNNLDNLSKYRQIVENETNSKPIAEFGTNFAEYYRDGNRAIAKVLAEESGQVAGAFYKEGLGEIDVVWGKITNAETHEGYGLSHIKDKHLARGDFKEFGEGEAGMIKAISEIIENGEVISENGVNTIIYRKGGDTYRVGLSKGWNKQGENQWMVTTYKVDKSQGSDFLPSSQSGQTAKSDGTNLHSNDSNEIIPQTSDKGEIVSNTSTKPAWHTFRIDDKDILKETEKAYFIRLREYDITDNSGKGIWISKKLVRRGANGYQVSLGSDFVIKPQGFQISYANDRDFVRGEYGYAKIFEANSSDFTNGENLAKLMNGEIDRPKRLNAEEQKVAEEQHRQFTQEREKQAQDKRKQLYDFVEQVEKDIAQEEKTWQKLYKDAEKMGEEQNKELYWNMKNPYIFLKRAKSSLRGVKSSKSFKDNALSERDLVALRDSVADFKRIIKEWDSNADFSAKVDIPQITQKALADSAKATKSTPKPKKPDDPFAFIMRTKTRIKEDENGNAVVKKESAFDTFIDFARGIRSYLKHKEGEGVIEQINETNKIDDELFTRIKDAISERVANFDETTRARYEELLEPVFELLRQEPSFVLSRNISEYRPSKAQFMRLKKQYLANRSDNGLKGDDVESWIKSHFREIDYKGENLGANMAKKWIAKIKEPEYQANLKAWAKDNPAWLNNADGTPKAFGGFYYRIHTENLEPSHLEAAKEAFVNFKNPIFFEQDLENAIWKHYDKKSILNSGKFTDENRAEIRAKWVSERESAMAKAREKYQGEIDKLNAEIDELQKERKAIKFDAFADDAFETKEQKARYDTLNNKIVERNEKIWEIEKKISAETDKAVSPEPPKFNVLNSNSTIGGGLVGGFGNGIETDENGNIIFNPQKFLAGFALGAGGSKALQLALKSPNTRRVLLSRVNFIENEYKALKDKNLKTFAKILNNLNPRIFTMDKKQMDIAIKEVFNKELQSEIQNAITSDKIAPLPRKSFKQIADFKAGFDSLAGDLGIIRTPYKDVKVDISYAWEHFRQNTYNTNRDNIKSSAFFVTFKEPLFVVEQTRLNKQGKEVQSVYFYKPFFDSDKKLVNLFGIGLDSSGSVDFKTFYLDERGTRIRNLLNDKNLVIRFVNK